MFVVAKRQSGGDSNTPRRRASTPAGRENQLIGLATDLAEKQMQEGTASAQVITHYLKAGSSKEYLERERLKMDVELMKAKQKQMESMARVEELYENAISSMRAYQGVPQDQGGDHYED